MMKKRYTALLLSMILALSFFSTGCEIGEKLKEAGASAVNSAVNEGASAINSAVNEEVSGILNNNKSSKSSEATEAAKESSKTSTDQNSKSEESNSGEYTMSDIYRLKNTDNFAKKTLEHIFDGTINAKGNATGYHYSMVSDSKGSIIDGTRSDTDENGVFTAKVKVKNVRKNGFSSFYPESWTPQQVVDAINVAYKVAVNDSKNPRGSLWIGYYENLEIDMYLDNNKKITTAYPVYEGD